MAVFERVRSARGSFFESLESAGVDSSSLDAQGVRQAVAAPIRDLRLPAGDDNFLGVLSVDRRGASPTFEPSIRERIESLATELSFVLKVLAERKAKASGDEVNDSVLMVAIEREQGCLNLVARRLLMTYDECRHKGLKAGLMPAALKLRRQRAPSNQQIGELLHECRDLRILGRRLGLDYIKLNDRVRKKRQQGGLAALVQECGLSWEAVFGPEFQRGEPTR